MFDFILEKRYYLNLIYKFLKVINLLILNNYKESLENNSDSPLKRHEYSVNDDTLTLKINIHYIV